jgi:DNA-binding MarR family transcriptional regulator
MPDRHPKPDLSQFQYVGNQCTCANLRKTSRVITQLYDEFLQPSGLLTTQFLLLGAIGTNSSIALTPLAQQLAMDPTTLARNLKPLQREGLVKISKGSDRRTRILRLTGLGETALVKAFPLWQQAQAWVIGQVGAARQQAMLGDWSDLVAHAQRGQR